MVHNLFLFMATISPSTFTSPSSARSDPNPLKLTHTSPKFTCPRLNRALSPSLLSQSLTRVSDSAQCRCQNHKNSTDNGDDSGWWDSAIHETVRKAIKWFDDRMNGYGKVKEQTPKDESDVVVDDSDGEWDWERWKKHFTEVDEQERVVSILKSQLNHSISREEYEDAARLKVAIAAAATNDTVGRVMSQFNKAVDEERYWDAAFVQDYAGAGLVGWWAGLSYDGKDPYGHIIRISAEHGRYVARSYSPRQLATAADGAPLFEIFLTMNKKGEYKHQAVYLKRNEVSRDFPFASSESSGLTSSLDPQDRSGDKGDFLADTIEDVDDDEDMADDSDMAEGSGFGSILRDMIPGAKHLKVKVLNVTTPGKIDSDLISKVVEQIMEEEDEEKDTESEIMDTVDEENGDIDDEENEIDVDTGNRIVDGEERSQIEVKLVIGGLIQNISNGTSHKDLIRVPASLEKKSRMSFSFSIEKDDRQGSSTNTQSLQAKKTKMGGNRSIDHVMLDLTRSIGKGKIPMKVLKDVGQLINLTLIQAQNRQALSGSTTFNRIDLPASADPLNGLYVGAHGLYTSEVIHLQRKFGQWQEDGTMKELSDLEFYEYVEAVKLIGDLYVPAGQVAFRAKVGMKYQLPHKGIIPEEFGVIARYRGQGRLAEPGFQNPRWVDGELVILDGKYMKGGPIVGFVYWAPEYHFLVFFNQLRLQE